MWLKNSLKNKWIENNIGTNNIPECIQSASNLAIHQIASHIFANTERDYKLSNPEWNAENVLYTWAVCVSNMGKNASSFTYIYMEGKQEVWVHEHWVRYNIHICRWRCVCVCGMELPNKFHVNSKWLSLKWRTHTNTLYCLSSPSHQYWFDGMYSTFVQQTH